MPRTPESMVDESVPGSGEDDHESITHLPGEEPSINVDSRDYGLIYMSVHHLSNDQKYMLLTKPFVPDSSFPFPTYIDNCAKKRVFQMSWLQTFPSLVYSPSLNGGFCKYCVLFGKAQSGQHLGILVSRPLTNLHKATETLRPFLW